MGMVLHFYCHLWLKYIVNLKFEEFATHFSFYHVTIGAYWCLLLAGNNRKTFTVADSGQIFKQAYLTWRIEKLITSINMTGHVLFSIKIHSLPESEIVHFYIQLLFIKIVYSLEIWEEWQIYIDSFKILKLNLILI